MESEGIGRMTPLILLIGGSTTFGTPTTGSLLYPASTPPTDSPSHALAGGTMARPWKQLAREWAGAEKAATERAVGARAGGRTARGGSVEGSVRLGGGGSERGSYSGQGGQRTQRRGLEAAGPRYVGSDAKSANPSLFTPGDHALCPGGNIPSFLLPLSTDISRRGHSLTNRAGR